MIDPPHGRNRIAETLCGARLRYFDTMADYGRCWPFRGANYRISRQSVRVEDAIISAILFAWNNSSLFKNCTRNNDLLIDDEDLLIPKKNFKIDRLLIIGCIGCILTRGN